MVDDADGNVDVSGDVANDMAANMSMMCIEGMMCTLTWPMMWLLTWQ